MSTKPKFYVVDAATGLLRPEGRTQVAIETLKPIPNHRLGEVRGALPANAEYLIERKLAKAVVVKGVKVVSEETFLEYSAATDQEQKDKIIESAKAVKAAKAKKDEDGE